MGIAIRSKFSTIDERIRAENKPVFEPLQIKVKLAQEALKKELD